MLDLNNKKYLSYLLFIFPPALISGPFLPDLVLTISSIYFLIFLMINKNLNYLNNDFFKMFFIFYIFIVIRSFFTDEVLFSLKNTLFYFRFIIFSYLLKFLIINEKNFLNLFTKSFLFTLVLISLDAIFEYLTGTHWLFDKSSYAEFIANNRISGLFDEEFILGGFILSFFPIILLLQFNFIKFKKKNLKYLLSIFLIMLFLIVILISGERASLVKLILVSTLVIFLTSIIKTFKKKILFFFTLTLIIYASILSQPKIKDRMIYHSFNLIFGVSNEDKKIGKDLSITEYLKTKKLENIKVKYFSKEHQDHAKVSLKMFNDKKLFGHGVKMFRFKCAEKKYLLNERSCSTHSHGIALTFLAEIGLIGLSFLLIIYFFLIKNILTINTNNEKITLISIFVYLFPFLPMGYFFNNFFSMILYTLVGIYLGSKKIKKRI